MKNLVILIAMLFLFISVSFAEESNLPFIQRFRTLNIRATALQTSDQGSISIPSFSTVIRLPGGFSGGNITIPENIVFDVNTEISKATADSSSQSLIFDLFIGFRYYFLEPGKLSETQKKSYYPYFLLNFDPFAGIFEAMITDKKTPTFPYRAGLGIDFPLMDEALTCYLEAGSARYLSINNGFIEGGFISIGISVLR